ncbi:MAG: threonine synthase [Gemmiger sp.]
MQYQSTRNPNTVVSSSQAILRGLAPDGGLFVPQSFPKADLQAWRNLSYPELAQEVLKGFLTDYDPEFLGTAARNTYGESFGGKAGHLEKVHDGLYALELWHGPTCAFKDYALQLMPKLLVQAKKNLGCTETTRILVATSGDTGKAALAGYAGLEGIEIEVFYPKAGTSEIQRLQMATQQGNNVAVYAVNGNFDDAQTGVKRVFGDSSVAEELEKRKIRLSSANSINWGRLAPQIVYYFYAYFRLAENGAVKWGEPVDFCVPTGNFGDILAGYYAKQMGLPVGKLVCASNRNNVLTDFIRTGTYDARRTFYKTTSPSMDILVSSNLERLLYHVTGDASKVAGWMAELASEGKYTVDAETLAAIQKDFACGCADDAQSAEEIHTRYAADHYLCDPHTAVAFCVAESVRTAAPMVVLSTASPFKFPRDVLKALGEQLPEGDFAAMDALASATGCEAPKSLSALKEMPVRFDRTIDPADIRTAALK